MDNYEAVNEIIVTLFNDIMSIEEKAVITEEFSDITNNDMHIIDAIGMEEEKTMSMVAKKLDVTLGTLTIAINNLVKKGYVTRNRSQKDKRVVLISLQPKGKKAFLHHKKFHEDMTRALLGNLQEDQVQILIKALENLRDFFLL
jgi:DNA-binding MarR family transcriptional regulator